MRDVYIVGAMRSPIAAVTRGRIPKDKQERLEALKCEVYALEQNENDLGVKITIELPPNTSSISSLSPTELSLRVLEALFSQSKVRPEDVEFFTLGSVISQKAERKMAQAPAKEIIMRTKPGCALGMSKTVEKACSTGLLAVAEAADYIAKGQAEIVIGGGVDMMSRQPDRLILGALNDPFTGSLMVELADIKTRELGITREELDDYAFKSYERARRYLQNHGKNMVNIDALNVDEEVIRFELSRQKIGEMKPFKPDGVITLAHCSKYGDAAAFVALASEEAVKQYNLRPLAKFLSYAENSERLPKDFVIAPPKAIFQAVNLANINLEDVDVFEVNEAFASVPLNLMRVLRIPHEKVNPWGGAVAHGHPIGATGALLLVKLITILQEEEKRYGVVSLCNAIAEATAAVIERV